MAISSEQFSQQLTQFGKSQLADIPARKICNTTVHLILTTAFFTGASIVLAKATKAPKKAYITALQQLLKQNFGLSEKNAAGMIESNARLYKRHKLIEKIYNTGWQAAQSWAKNHNGTDNTLKTLLEEYHDLDMSNLNIEGIKEEKTVAPPKWKLLPMWNPHRCPRLPDVGDVWYFGYCSSSPLRQPLPIFGFTRNKFPWIYYLKNYSLQNYIPSSNTIVLERELIGA